jgi:CBS domain containing-hemolysin-like protein
MILLAILVFAGLLASACFSGFENGMIQVRQARLDTAVESGSGGARLIKFFLERPAVMLSTILLGNNLSNCFTAIFFDEFVRLAIEPLPKVEPLVASAVASAALTVVVLIFGEVTPKVWFRQRPFYRCQIFVYPIFAFYKLTAWVVSLLSWLTQQLDRLSEQGPHESGKTGHLREEFRHLLIESETDGLIEPDVRQLLDDGLDFHRYVVSDIMLPRAQVRAVTAGTGLSAAVAYASEHGLSRLPVARDDDGTEWAGVFSVYDAIFRVPRDRWDACTVLDVIRPMTTIHAAAPINAVMTLSRANKSPLLVVVDERGAQRGVVTTQDMAALLFGKVRL